MTKTIYCYLRVSTNDQTLENSKMNILEHLVKNNYDTSNVKWIMEKISGYNYTYKERKIGTEILPNIKEGDMLIVSSLSRISRRLSDILSFVENEVAPRNFTLIIVKQNIKIDGSPSAMNKMLLSVLAMCAEFEITTLRERTRDGIKRFKNENGRWGRKKGKGKMKLDKNKDIILKSIEEGVKKSFLAKKYKVCPNTISNFVKRYKTK